MTMKTDHVVAESRLLAIKDLAGRLNVSVKTVRRLIDGKELKAHRIGRQWRIREEDYRRFLENRAYN